jgi:cyclic pyranopterin phosphate synthase
MPETASPPDWKGDRMLTQPTTAYADSTVQFQGIPRLATASRLQKLRLSVTDRCNYRCCYCMPSEGVPKLAHKDILPLEEIARLVDWLSVSVGISCVKLTGGEPLVRKGISSLIARLSTIPTIHDISLTTNGTLLARMAWSLKKAGLQRVNISLDSIDEDRFALVTRGGRLQDTLEGIAAACDAGLTPIKLNTVLQRSTWKQEVPRLLDYAAAIGVEIRFIELMRMGTEREWCNAEFVSVDEVCNGLGFNIMFDDAASHSPARKTLLKWRGHLMNVGWITPRSHPFCNRCERLRMDARGLVRRCLMDPFTLNLAHIMGTMDNMAVHHEFERYMEGKARPLVMDSPFAMSQIGG